ncbi:hypothetical protein GUJ93_ZPchr0012g19448 [Zizania palustris]|uniref:Uncharacterized protein n=1 Tax=Zizania palustris TaxID=103762 RepID=A0A8J5WQN1_ZIZPA|nr:hypothetical protein GUJ93_ZPchr0012g19448 [Zizania palustris]
MSSPPGAERGQVRVYQEKIAKWQVQVEERLRVLSQRSGESLRSLFLINLPDYLTSVLMYNYSTPEMWSEEAKLIHHGIVVDSWFVAL